jgi:hypothetical protein
LVLDPWKYKWLIEEDTDELEDDNDEIQKIFKALAYHLSILTFCCPIAAVI